MVSIYIRTGLPATPIQSYQYLLNSLFSSMTILPTETFFLNAVYMGFTGAAGSGDGYTVIGPGSSGFTFPGGSFDPGELPIGPIGSVEGYALPGGPNTDYLLISVSGFSLTWAELPGGGISMLLAGNDNLSGSDGDDRIKGFAGRDNLGGGAGRDTLYGGDGNDTLLTYGTGDDDLIGGAGDDRLTASLGDDDLDGGFGRDTLGGASGSDTLLGGGGADMFDFRVNISNDGLPGGIGAAARDVVLDFQIGTDTINLDGYNGAIPLVLVAGGFTGSFQFRLALRGADTLVQVNLDGDLTPEFGIMVKGVTALTLSDFTL